MGGGGGGGRTGILLPVCVCSVCTSSPFSSLFLSFSSWHGLAKLAAGVIKFTPLLPSQPFFATFPPLFHTSDQPGRTALRPLLLLHAFLYYYLQLPSPSFPPSMAQDEEGGLFPPPSFTFFPSPSSSHFLAFPSTSFLLPSILI